MACHHHIPSSESGFWIYVVDGMPSFASRYAADMPKIFVLTIPKSGTYLIAKYLSLIGVVDSGVHLAGHNMQDNRFADIEILRKDPKRFKITMDLNRTLPYILPGQFAFGHIPRKPHHITDLADFNKIFAYRELRDMIVSVVRYYGDLRADIASDDFLREPDKHAKARRFSSLPMGEERILLWFDLWGAEYIELINNMLAWRKDPTVSLVRYETMMGNYGIGPQRDLLRRVADKAGFSGVPDNHLLKCFEDARGEQTMTKQKTPSKASLYWGPASERMFEIMGFSEANRSLGY